MKIPNTLEDFESIKGKAVTLKVSNRLMRQHRLHTNGMSFRVVGTFPNTKEVMLEPLPEAFKDELQLMPISFYGIECDVTNVFEIPTKT